MSDSKYEKAMQDVGRLVKNRMDLRGISPKSAAKFLHYYMGIAPSTAYVYIIEVRNGEIINSWNGNVSRTRKLERLAILMYSIGVESDDELVSKTRNLYLNFQFPPQESKQFVLEATPPPDNPYKDLSLVEKLGKLKPNDYQRLERTVDNILASYPIKNKKN